MRRYRALYIPRPRVLYVMHCGFDPDGHGHGYAIGSTECPERRLMEHNRGLPFHMVVDQIFEGAGFLESKIHQRLAAYRNRQGLGREWFLTTLDHILEVVQEEIEYSDYL